MHFLRSPRFLAALLWADAASGAATAVVQLAAPDALSLWFGLPSTWLIASGALLWLYVALAASLASRAAVPRGPALVLVAGNAAWALGCLALALGGAAGTGLGQAYLLVQAVAVGLLAELQWFALRQARQPGWA